MSREGALLAARFSFMPNRLGFCGPEENRAMLEYVADGHSDLRPGDVVAVHWGCACHCLTRTQHRYLAHYTRLHLALANRERRGHELAAGST